MSEWVKWTKSFAEEFGISYKAALISVENKAAFEEYKKNRDILLKEHVQGSRKEEEEDFEDPVLSRKKSLPKRLRQPEGKPAKKLRQPEKKPAKKPEKKPAKKPAKKQKKVETSSDEEDSSSSEEEVVKKRKKSKAKKKTSRRKRVESSESDSDSDSD